MIRASISQTEEMMILTKISLTLKVHALKYSYLTSIMCNLSFLNLEYLMINTYTFNHLYKEILWFSSTWEMLRQFSFEKCMEKLWSLPTKFFSQKFYDFTFCRLQFKHYFYFLVISFVCKPIHLRSTSKKKSNLSGESTIPTKPGQFQYHGTTKEWWEFRFKL